MNTINRRKFIRDVAASTAGLVILPALPKDVPAAFKKFEDPVSPVQKTESPRIRFSVIGINHGHINSMTDAVIRGGGEFVSFYAAEPVLRDAFSKKYPQAALARNEQEILEDKTIQLVLSSIIPDERAPLGIRVMQHGKDYLVDKPGITTLEQLAAVKKVQKETKRIYSILYSERFENRATGSTLPIAD